MRAKHNFVLPVETLHGDDFQLEPFEADRHASAYWAGTGPATDLYAYMPMGPFESKDAFVKDYMDPREADPAHQMYAIMTTRKPKNGSIPGSSGDGPELAGIAGYWDLSRRFLRVEIGPVVLLPRYQGVGLAAAVVEVMVQHAFKGVADGGFGLMRVSWLCHSKNSASMKLAEKLGFRREGLMKWDMVFRDGIAKGKIGNGRDLPLSSSSGDLGRDTVVFSRCFDD